MLRLLRLCVVIFLSIVIFALAPAGCGEHTPDRREALKPEEKEPRYPGLEVNPPDVYEYMEAPADVGNASGAPPSTARPRE